MTPERIYPSATLARYDELETFLALTEETGLAWGRLPRFLTPVVKAQEVIRERGEARVFVEEVHAVLWYVARFGVPLEQALEEIAFLLQWRMVQPEVNEAVWQGIREVFEARPRVYARFQELRERREALEAWLGWDRMDLAGLFLEASEHVERPDAVRVGFGHRFIPTAQARFLSRFPEAEEEGTGRGFRLLQARIYPRLEAEAHAVARHLRDHPPKHPHRTVVALGNPEMFPLYERVFVEYGIPYLRPGGPLLSRFPIFHLLDTGVAFLEYAHPSRPGEVPEELRERLVREPALGEQVRGRVEGVIEKLAERYARGATPEGKLPVSGWVSLMETWLEETLAAVDHPRFRETRERANRMLEELRFAVEAGGDPLLLPRPFRLLLHQFARKFRVPEEEEGGGIWLVNFPEDLPLGGERLYVVGFSEKALPRYPYHPWVPLRHVQRFGWPSPEEIFRMDRARFGKTLHAFEEVWLSTSRTDEEDRQVAPNPLLIPYMEQAPKPAPAVHRAYRPWETERKNLPDLPREGVVLEGEDLALWLRKLEKDGLSVTHVVTYARCPFRFYLGVVVRVPEKEPPEVLPTRLDLGKLFHQAYEKVLKTFVGQPVPGPEELVKAAEAEVKAMLAGHSPLEQALLGEELRRLVWNMEALERDLQARGFRILAGVEIEGEAQVEGVPLRGKLDRVMAREDGEEIVVDYKTSRTPDSDALPAYMLQLEAYVHMRPRAQQAVFLYPRKGEAVFLEPNRSLLLSDVLQNIRSGRFPTTERPDKVCSSCPYARICPVGREVEAWK